jgi:hypothetical protein
VRGRDLVERMRKRRSASGSVGAILFMSIEADALLGYIEELERAANLGKTTEDESDVNTTDA